MKGTARCAAAYRSEQGGAHAERAVACGMEGEHLRACIDAAQVDTHVTCVRSGCRMIVVTVVSGCGLPYCCTDGSGSSLSSRLCCLCSCAFCACPAMPS